jgi:hypothetical protein
MATHYVPDGLQSFAAMAIFVLIFAVPLYNIIMWSRAPSFFHRRPWRVVLALASLALIAPAAGFVLMVVLTEVSKPLGWSLFSGDAGMRALFVLIVAGALYLLAAIGVALVTLLRGRRKEPS